MIKGFEKLDNKTKDETYGGNALFMVLIPMVLQAVVTTVASIKSMFSDKGSIKGKDISAQWDTKETASSSTEKAPVVNYYAY